VARTVRLPLSRPVSLTGAREGIWIADAGSKAAILFDAATADLLARVTFEHAPVSVAAADSIVAVALESGEVAAIGAGDRRERWRRRLASQDAALAASRDRVWAWDRLASVFLTWDQSGGEERFDAAGAAAFAAHQKGVYSLSPDGLLRVQLRSGRSESARLPDDALPASALVACANGLWIGAPNALLLAAEDTVTVRARLPAPEAQITHLVCFHGRIFGGGRHAVFSVEPAADAGLRSLDVRPAGALLGLAVSGRHLWVHERSNPDVHVIGIP
jgi:hypothetical protein